MTTSANGDFATGYGRPPAHAQFKPGQSGNPRGRPPGRFNLKTAVERILSEKIEVQKGGQRCTMTNLEALLDTHVARAIDGDHRSAGIVLSLVTLTGAGFGDQDDADGGAAAYKSFVDSLFASLDRAPLSDDDLKELSRLAEVIELGGDFTALSTNDFQLLKHIFNKGRGKDVTPSE